MTGSKALIAGLLVACAAACTRHTHEIHHYQHIVVVGNSLTRHPPLAAIGWKNDWGMAATARDSDFVHILTRRFQQENPAATVKYQNIAEWEGHYWRYNLSRLDTIRLSKPDLVIVRIGENVKGDSILQRQFSKQLSSMVSHLTGASTRVVVVSGFWGGNPAIDAMKAYAQAHNLTYVSLATIGDNESYRATGQYSSGAVSAHPSNRGMLAIANAIWDNL